MGQIFQILAFLIAANGYYDICFFGSSIRQLSIFS